MTKSEIIIDYYKVLGISRRATIEKIENTIEEILRGPSLNVLTPIDSEIDFLIKSNIALAKKHVVKSLSGDMYKHLLNPVARARYDAQLNKTSAIVIVSNIPDHFYMNDTELDQLTNRSKKYYYKKALSNCYPFPPLFHAFLFNHLYNANEDYIDALIQNAKQYLYNYIYFKEPSIWDKLFDLQVNIEDLFDSFLEGALEVELVNSFLLYKPEELLKSIFVPEIIKFVNARKKIDYTPPKERLEMGYYQGLGKAEKYSPKELLLAPPKNKDFFQIN